MLEAAERLDNAPETRPPASASPRTRTLTLKRRHDGLTAAAAEARLRHRLPVEPQRSTT